MELWETDAFKRWWDEDWSWDGLAGKHRRSRLSYWERDSADTLQSLWRDEAPHLIVFGVNADGTPRRWTRAHLPPFDTEGNRCPEGQWNAAKVVLEADLTVLQPSAGAGADGDSGDAYRNLCGVVFRENPLSQTCIGVDFASAIFLSEVQFRHVARARFDHAVFAIYATFDGATFEDAEFDGAVFVSMASFRDAKLSSVGFSNVTFLSPADFRNAVFTIRTTFYGADFAEGANFESAEFVERVDFDRAQFRAGCRFTAAKFSGWASFSGAIFTGDAEFQLAIFEESAGFADATFKRRATFNCASLYGASFARVGFQDEASFKEVRFGSAWFEEATFAGPVSFKDATFSRWLNISSPLAEAFAFVRPVDFSGARFLMDSDFCGRRFLAKTDFSDAALTGVPLFHAAALYPETIFSRSSFDIRRSLNAAIDKWIADTGRRASPDQAAELGRQAYWARLYLRLRLPRLLRLPATRALRAFIDSEMNRHELAYRTLRLRFAEHRNTEYEMMFYELELDARHARGSTPFFFEGLLMLLYRTSSRYGQDLRRPIVCFLAVWLGAVALLTGLQSRSASPLSWFGRIANASDWVLRRLIPLSGWGRDEDAAWLGHIAVPGLITLLTILLPMISVGLIAVFLIALRRRFQVA